MKPRNVTPVDNAPGVRFAIPINLWIIGFLAIDFAVVMTALLTADSLVGLSLPGCGVGSPCAAAAASFWGKVPGLGIPVSYVGLAYFLAMLAGWVQVGRFGMTVGFRQAARLGMAASVFFIVVLLREGHLCWYCVLTHVANLGFWLIVELAGAPAAVGRRVMAVVAAVFFIMVGGLQAAHVAAKGREEQRQEAKLAESTQAIAAASKEKAAAGAMGAASPAGSTEATKPAAQNGSAGTSAGSSSVAAKAPADADLARPWTGGFTGRWRRGPEQAAIRIVMLMDYQCIDCQRIETQQVARLMKERTDVSLSVKHFPMCADCNDAFAKHNLHPNACWAARAAETAGILQGNDGFWRMHDWLFERRGNFTNHELMAGLVELGFDRAEFLKVMQGEETERLVKADIAEGIWLGLHYTPMVFINGVELVGVFAPNAVSRAVETLAQQNLPPMTCDLDQPPPASEKVVGDWLAQPIRMIPPDEQGWPVGPANAAVRIVLWGDFQEPYSAQVDAIMRNHIAAMPSVRYEFRHFPWNQACNPVVSSTKHERACRAAFAAEAAGMIGGPDAYWKMHEWLMANPSTFSDETLRAAADGMGLNADDLFSQMDRVDVKMAVSEDCRTGKSLQLTGIPFIFVNERFVPRWTVGDEPVIGRILDAAAAGK